MPYATTKWKCAQCGNEQVSVYEVGTPSLECSHCHVHSCPVQMIHPPLVISVVQMNGATWVQVNRPCDRISAMGLLAEALGMMQQSSAAEINPENSELRLFLTLDDSQIYQE